MAGCYLHPLSFSNFAVPSSIIQITQDQNVTEGHDVTLMCNVSGIPLPMVSWVTPDSQRVSGYKLKVTNIDRTQTGEYKWKPVMNVAMQQRQQTLLCCVSLKVPFH